MKGAFGTPPGYRPAHAKGIMVTGTFTPTAEAKSLSSAPHFNNTSTPVTVRFSSSTGIPQIPDTDPNGMPRGMAVRFNLGTDEKGLRKHTDIVTHSTKFFPVRTGELFLEFLGALGASATSTEKPSPVEKFLGSHPSALAFVTDPKPFPESFGTEAFYGVNAFKFINSEGKETYVRYRTLPDTGLQTLDEEALKSKGPNFLSEELPKRIAEGPIGFKLFAQIAEEGDVTDDATVHWPDERKIVELGSLSLDKMVEDTLKEQKHIIYDPVPRVEGIEPSADPLIDVRAALYLISGKQRRAA